MSDFLRGIAEGVERDGGEGNGLNPELRRGGLSELSDGLASFEHRRVRRQHPRVARVDPPGRAARIAGVEGLDKFPVRLVDGPSELSQLRPLRVSYVW